MALLKLEKILFVWQQFNDIFFLFSRLKYFHCSDIREAKDTNSAVTVLPLPFMKERSQALSSHQLVHFFKLWVVILNVIKLYFFTGSTVPYCKNFVKVEYLFPLYFFTFSSTLLCNRSFLLSLDTHYLGLTSK